MGTRAARAESIGREILFAVIHPLFRKMIIGIPLGIHSVVILGGLIKVWRNAGKGHLRGNHLKQVARRRCRNF